MVFAGLYPMEGKEFETLRDALGKLRLNDSSFTYQPETSTALGFGFRCGFLGMLHLDIVKERLEREFELEIVVTAPNVEYWVRTKEGEELEIKNPSEMPSSQKVAEVKEPYVRAYVLTPSDMVGPVMELCQERRGVFKDLKYLSTQRVEVSYMLPLSEMVSGFYDQLKGRTSGYGSLDYDHAGYRPGDLVKLEILLKGEPIDAFAMVLDKDSANRVGRNMVKKLRKMIPRQLFEVPIQAAVGGRVIARETLAPRRKDVTAKCYGGDITRKRKLREKQKAGKKRLKKVGKIELPAEAFVSFLSREE